MLDASTLTFEEWVDQVVKVEALMAFAGPSFQGTRYRTRLLKHCLSDPEIREQVEESYRIEQEIVKWRKEADDGSQREWMLFAQRIA